MATASGLILKPQTGTSGKTLYAAWTWDTSKHTHTKEYSVQFQYCTGDQRWFSGSNTTATLKNATYSPPENAVSVRFRVKPISQTYTQSNKTKNYWTADWSVWKEYAMRNLTPDIPPTPTLTVNDNFTKLTMTCDIGEELTGSTINIARAIDFYIYAWDLRTNTELRKVVSNISVNWTGRASTVYTMTPGYKYKVRCRAKDAEGNYSPYSNYTDEWVYAKPAVPSKGIHTCYAVSSTQININWDREGSAYADTYCIEYATNKNYFDVSPENVKSVTLPVSSYRDYYIFTGLEPGYTYYFRLRLQGGYNNGYSAWTPIVSAIVAKKPSAPTTWALSTTAEAGGNIELYWTHNSQDSSPLTYSQIELSINGVSSSTSNSLVIKNSINEDLKDKTNSIIISTSDSTILDGKTGEVVETFYDTESKYIEILKSKQNLQDLEGCQVGVEKLTDLDIWTETKERINSNKIIILLSKINDPVGRNLYTDVTNCINDFDNSYSSENDKIVYDENLRADLENLLVKVEDYAKNWERTSLSVKEILSNLSSGGTLLWRVRTCGVALSGNAIPDTDDPSADYGDWSILRTVTINAPPTLEMYSDIDDENVFTLRKYPFQINLIAGPENQYAIRYFITISTKESYEKQNIDGSVTTVAEGSIVYSEYIDGPSNETIFEVDASKVQLLNGVTYQISALVTMSSGLIATTSKDILVSLGDDDEYYEILADAVIDSDNLTARITPRVSRYLSGEFTYDINLLNDLIDSIQDIIDYANGLEALHDSDGNNVLDSDGNKILVTLIRNNVSSNILNIYQNENNIQELTQLIHTLKTDSLITIDDLHNVEQQLYNSEIVSSLLADYTGTSLFNAVFEKYTILESSIKDAYITSFVDDALISVYRHSANGKFVPIETNILSGDCTTITDPHPPLDYAQYRITAVLKDSGQMLYYDLPSIEVGIKSIIINWNEKWSKVNIPENINESDIVTWEGSMLKIPYNIDVSEDYASDVTLIEYIGREHPVDYYGTQLGENGKWSFEIEREDTETLYALRRLAVYQNSVYVREPSGIGYWANVTVSISQKHCAVTIPITLTVTRVEGGV